MAEASQVEEEEEYDPLNPTSVSAAPPLQRQPAAATSPAAASFTPSSTATTTAAGPQTRVGEDGTTYYWNAASSMWLPLIDEELIKQQQEAYGGTPSEPTAKKRKYPKKLKPGEEPQVVENPCDLYVEGLPPSITLDQFTEHFAKAGAIRKDPETGVVKAKLYHTPEGKVKGDGLICYFKEASVSLALSILDGVEIAKGFPLKLSVAKFVQKPQVKKKKPKNKKNRKLVDQAKELGWEENENVHVVIKHMFDPKEAVEDENFFKELRDDITAECSKFGDVAKVVVFEFNPEGVVVVKFNDGVGATKCVQVMNGRFFAQRKLVAELYDGITNYFVAESEELKQARIKKWESWLDDNDDDNNKDDNTKDDDKDKDKDADGDQDKDASTVEG